MTPDELFAAGWTVEKALLYDEECVEGPARVADRGPGEGRERRTSHY